MANKQKRMNPMGSVTPQENLDKALYVFSFLPVLIINYLQEQLTAISGWSLHLRLNHKYGIKNLGNFNVQ